MGVYGHIGPYSSYDWIQITIFNRKCIDCHSGTKAAAGLTLDGSSSFYKLLGAYPTNTNAKADGLLRLQAYDTSTSFLFTKITADNGYLQPKGYGGKMPQQREALLPNEIEFIRQWIITGAFRYGYNVDTLLLMDTSPFQKLSIPASGFQINLGPLTVNPKTELEHLVYQKLSNATAVYLNGWEVRQRQRPHHFILQDLSYLNPADLPPEGQVRDSVDYAKGFAPLLIARTGYEKYFLPPGTGLPLDVNHPLDLHLHYNNYTDTMMTAEVSANLYTLAEVQVTRALKYFKAGTDTFTLPAGAGKVIKSYSVPFTKDIELLLMTTYQHQLGISAKVFIHGGENDSDLIYENIEWDAPVTRVFTPPITLKTGEALRIEMTYGNSSSSPVSFGFKAVQEVGFVVGYYAELSGNSIRQSRDISLPVLNLFYPNPFPTGGWISAQGQAMERSRLLIYSLAGQLIRGFENNLAGGQIQTSYFWNGTDDRGYSVGPGPYLIKLEQGRESLEKILILIK